MGRRNRRGNRYRSRLMKAKGSRRSAKYARKLYRMGKLKLY